MHRIEGGIAVALIVALTGCATIIHGGTQDIRVSSQPPGAVVRVQGMATTTPGVLKLERKGTYTLVFEKEGYKAVEVQLNKTVDGWLFGNIIFGGLIGLVIDFVSGAAYKLTPSEVNSVLEYLPPPGTPGSPIPAPMKPTSKNLHRNDVVVFVDFDRLSPELRSRLKDRKPI